MGSASRAPRASFYRIRVGRIESRVRVLFAIAVHFHETISRIS